MSVYISYIAIKDEIKVSDKYFMKINEAFKWLSEFLSEKLEVENVKQKMRKNMRINDTKLFFLVDGATCVIVKIKKYIINERQCNICMVLEDDEDVDWEKMKCCDLYLHSECKENLLKNAEECPSCKTCLIDPETRIPFGLMTISKDNVQVEFKGKLTGLKRIHFNLQGGVNNIGPYPPDSRLALIPDTEEGKKLIDMFIHGFKLGVIFKIGDSLTTSRKNVIVYGSVHMKTAYTGPYGFPDDNYIDRAMNELASSSNIIGPWRNGNYTLDDLAEGNHKVFIQ